MQAGRRYSFWLTVRWSSKFIFIFIVLDTIPVLLYHFMEWEWLHIPWQPISLIGIAVAFYLGFKNNSSYDRMWEARKIWGGIVNASRSFTVMARDYVNNDETEQDLSEEELQRLRKSLVHRHVAWLRSLAIEMRKIKSWEHNEKHNNVTRKWLGTEYSNEKFDEIKPYLSEEDFEYVMSKGNRSSHLLSLQSKHLSALRKKGAIEHWRHLKMQDMITELYTLMGKSERIKNFPFPRQYASVNFFFVVMFIVLLPFGMLDVFVEVDQTSTLGESNNFWIWVTIPFTVVASWVFWMMEMIGDYSENPFEGLHNDVPISSMAVGIERDIRQMIDETDLPDPISPDDKYQVVS